MTNTLAAAVSRSVAMVGPFGASYPLYVEHPLGAEVVPASAMLTAETLLHFSRRAIAEWSDHPEAENTRAAVSRFMRRYVASIAAASLVPLAEGVAVDVAIPRVALVIRNEMPMGVVVDLSEGVATSPGRPTSWPVRGEALDSVEALRERALHNLFADHLVPAITSVHESFKLARSLLWTTVAEQVGELYTSAITAAVATGEHARHRRLTDDRAAILDAERVPGTVGPNPLRHRFIEEPTSEPGLPPFLSVRKICCTCYVIPGRNTHCRSCPMLAPADRQRLWRSFLTRN